MTKQNAIRLAELFLKKSRQDLDSCKILLNHGSYGDSCYFAQQSIEKIIKASLILKSGEFPREHNIVGIFTQRVIAFVSPEWEKKFKKILPDIIELQEHWLKPKYPYITDSYEWDPTSQYKESDAKKAYKKAKNIINVISEFLKENFLVE